eukprot:CAMPEP_0113309470 /NCGR_PEP_ID=MMETSP0010_2-20120614/7501_1 /TAXON_ID=216773 ORGANISM="Corethron hystrix, Strain 308" /NCGR_SAMPLE_ID=MMETSP0010_2 /ASSEMBLY_ACC=CAM_ASM_000155 /LENGTH=43 /DNA_ID=CAMNT_0000164729 /DNA_START=452 /DNA_END=583 /DNA_ORIENTATION=- /assembly_acc=CAM_ASM_000155
MIEGPEIKTVTSTHRYHGCSTAVPPCQDCGGDNTTCASLNPMM